jgi:hypothetical protein
MTGIDRLEVAVHEGDTTKVFWSLSRYKCHKAIFSTLINAAVKLCNICQFVGKANDSMLSTFQP